MNSKHPAGEGSKHHIHPNASSHFLKAHLQKGVGHRVFFAEKMGVLFFFGMASKWPLVFWDCTILTC